MNQTTAYANESHFGPPSDVISVEKFIEDSHKRLSVIAEDWLNWSGLTSERKFIVEKECGVDDLSTIVNETLRKPTLYAFVTKSHEDNNNTIQATVDPRSGAAKARKRKRAAQVPEDVRDPVEVAQLRTILDSVVLKSWHYTVDAAAFMRAPKNSDFNVLDRGNVDQVSETHSTPVASVEGLLFVSVHNRLSWGNHLSRSSQHVVLSSQTLGELYEAIPCPSNELPEEKWQGGAMQGYSENVSEHRGGVISIEGVAFGDGQSEEDYSDKLIKHNESLPEAKRMQIRKGPCMHEQAFAGLSLRLHQPYWLLHQGSCEHFLVVDQIRLRHSEDPHAYPKTLQLTPPILDLCQACSKVPAMWSVVGDVRLGQSPCILCAPCWRMMGDPAGQDGVLITPLPRHQLGW